MPSRPLPLLAQLRVRQDRQRFLRGYAAGVGHAALKAFRSAGRYSGRTLASICSAQYGWCFTGSLPHSWYSGVQGSPKGHSHMRFSDCCLIFVFRFMGLGRPERPIRCTWPIMAFRVTPGRTTCRSCAQRLAEAFSAQTIRNALCCTSVHGSEIEGLDTTCFVGREGRLNAVRLAETVVFEQPISCAIKL